MAFPIEHRPFIQCVPRGGGGDMPPPAKTTVSSSFLHRYKYYVQLVDIKKKSQIY